MWSAKKKRVQHEIAIADAHPPYAWAETEFLLTGAEYLEEVIRACDDANESIRMESYIFDRDENGKRLLEALRAAAQRGVKVRLVIDAIGSPDWGQDEIQALAATNVRVRVFGRPRELVRLAFHQFFKGSFLQAFRTLKKFQFRNHRKLVVVDGRIGFVGSANIGSRFSGWRETTAVLRGPGVQGLKQSFVRSWHLAARERVREERQWRLSIRTNFTRHERQTSILHLLTRIEKEQKRLYITTAYFFPRPRLSLALFAALRRGVDLRILSPLHSDIAWFPWLSRAVFSGLIEKGAKIYEYGGAMNHAKTMVFSSAAIVGSTNMNYRSFIHDLELDVILDDAKAVKDLEQIFAKDLEKSVLLTPDAIHGYAPYAFLISLLLTPLKRWV